MFANHLLEIFDYFEGDVVLLIAEIHERARVRTVFGYDHFHCIHLFRGSKAFVACTK